MQKIKLLILYFVIVITPLLGQNTYETRVNDTMIKTLQVKIPDETMSIPVIPIDGSEQIEISFDYLADIPKQYAYSIIHCDADWKQSLLIPLDYMEGFQGLPIEDYSHSIATTTQYTNYLLYLPNQDVRFKTSGNYAVNIYEESNPNRIVATACFSVVEPSVGISAFITSNTLIDVNKNHQQVGFTIDHPHLSISFPQSELKFRVTQNNRNDNVVTEFAPMTILNNRVVYENVRELIFKAGNEYRRMEFLTNTFNGMHVERIAFHNPYYNVGLYADLPRTNGTYQYDQDQNGRIFVNCNSCNDPYIEADYYVVHFTLVSKRLPDSDIYIQSEAFNNVYDTNSRMEYDSETGEYYKSALLKQGHYNYQYVVVPKGEKQAITHIFEGDYFEAENEYAIYVYYRPMGERYDRLVGVQTVSNRMEMLK